MNGILSLWKPKGLTSHDCVVKVRKLFQTKKVGHTGTLDPDVEGVLPICIGQATKIVPFLTDTRKTYTGKLKLGISTETEDASGDIVDKKKVTTFPSSGQTKAVFQGYTGSIKQKPPMYSAVKVKGKKLYEYARANEVVERPVRDVTIFQLELIQQEEEENCISFRVECSKGTYIRTLCVDIGKSLGYPAHMVSLTREKTGAFSKKNAVTFATIEEAVEQQKESELLYPLQKGLSHLDCLYVNHELMEKVLHGQKLIRTNEMHTDPFTVMYQDRVLAIYQVHPEKPAYIKPVRVFSK
ncbi:tRNA pseudouridine(55) synthase TruB [Virgibacillus salexigens]|uniref:tRNA pseudouridine(55) synthase TruB n=1 Tax=Virgibacillus salexigens TaxID=61016 RepID=UPI00190C76CF|nr:tRNA pseudouridine(55) synthase TruB [Virgibacillus salexigens]